MKSKRTPTPHDRYFKQLFTQMPEVQDFISSALPEISKRIDVDSLELDNNSYIDKKLDVNFADIVYNCKLKGKKAKIALIFEHKSQIDTIPDLQLLTYMSEFLNTLYKQEKRLTPLISILFYHGKDGYNFKPFEEYFEGLDDFLKDYI